MQCSRPYRLNACWHRHAAHSLSSLRKIPLAQLHSTRHLHSFVHATASGSGAHIRLTCSSSAPTGTPHATPHSCLRTGESLGNDQPKLYAQPLQRHCTCPETQACAGESLGDSELIRQTHNSFAAPHSFLSEEARAAKEEDDVFHFISYLPAMGRLWELDGLKPGPIDLGPCSEVQPLSLFPLVCLRPPQLQQLELVAGLLLSQRSGSVWAGACGSGPCLSCAGWRCTT